MMAACSKPLFAAISLLALSTIACNNPADALKLRLQSADPILIPGRPMLVETVFSADHGTIAIDRPDRDLFKAVITNLDTGQTHEPRRHFICGTAMVMNPLFYLGVVFYPVVWMGAGMDVADVGGRYTVVTPKQTHRTTLVLTAWSHDEFMLHDLRERDLEHANSTLNSKAIADRQDAPAPGRYRLCLTYQCQDDPCPPRPLFWSVYDQPVTAEIEFTVAAVKSPQ